MKRVKKITTWAIQTETGSFVCYDKAQGAYLCEDPFYGALVIALNEKLCWDNINWLQENDLRSKKVKCYPVQLALEIL